MTVTAVIARGGLEMNLGVTLQVAVLFWPDPGLTESSPKTWFFILKSRDYSSIASSHLHESVVVVDRGQPLPPDRLYGDRVNYQDCDQRSWSTLSKDENERKSQGLDRNSYSRFSLQICTVETDYKVTAYKVNLVVKSPYQSPNNALQSKISSAIKSNLLMKSLSSQTNCKFINGLYCMYG